MELNRENVFLDSAYTGKCRRCHHEDSLSEFRQFYLTCIGTDDPSATDENEPSIKKAKFDQAVDGVNDNGKALEAKIEAANQKVLDLEKQLAVERKQKEKEIDEKVSQKVSQFHSQFKSSNKKEEEELVENNDAKILEDDKDETIQILKKKLEQRREKATEDIKEAERVAREQEQEKYEAEKLRLKLENENKSAQLERLQQIMQQNQRTEMSNRDKGEIHERVLYEKLSNIEEFGCDKFTRVPKLARGADTIHSIFTDDRKFAGKILYEAKNTDDWSEKWLNKFIGDQSQEGAKFGIIVTNKFPKSMGEKQLGLKKGIFICGLQNVEVVARVLRNCVTEIFGIQCSEENRLKKSDQIYDYILGDNFSAFIKDTMNSHLEMANNRRLLRSYVINFANCNDNHGNVAQDAISSIIGYLKSVTGAFQNMNEIKSNGRNVGTTSRKRIQKSGSILNQSSIADLFKRESVLPGGSSISAVKNGTTASASENCAAAGNDSPAEFKWDSDNYDEISF